MLILLFFLIGTKHSPYLLSYKQFLFVAVIYKYWDVPTFLKDLLAMFILFCPKFL